jgi:hypothetical protein
VGQRPAGASKYGFGRVGILPEGMFLTKGIFYGARMAIKGASRSGSILATIPGGTQTACLRNVNGDVDFPVIQDLTILGNKSIEFAKSGFKFISKSGGTPLPQVDPYPYFAAIEVHGAASYGWQHLNRGAGITREVTIRECGYYGLYSAGYDTQYSNIISAANRMTGIYFSRNGAGNNMRGGISFFNGANAYAQSTGAPTDPNGLHLNWEDAANMFIGGTGQQVSNSARRKAGARTWWSMARTTITA